ncbi:MAG TPA: metabolite traffic protein EboE [Verrucomicrobiae bacterium]
MKLNHGLHLTYCTNDHRGETWTETFGKLQQHTLAVRERICPHQPFGISLRLSGRAARELNDRATLLAFHRWLDEHQCYVLGIHGFPCGHLRDRLAAAQVFVPDWTSPVRLAYTNLLFDLLAQLLPANTVGIVSTLPGAIKGVAYAPEELRMLRDHLWQCVEHVARLSERSGRILRLGLEPGPYCLLESSGETIEFFQRLRSEHLHDSRLAEFLTVNYDACHFAVEYEEPVNAIACLHQHGIHLGKVQLSTALRVCLAPEIQARLAAFKEESYQHQVVALLNNGERILYRNLAQALWQAAQPGALPAEEWRIHMHVPLHGPDGEWFVNTNDHVMSLLDLLAANPEICPQLEIETQTWGVLPPEWQQRSLAEQIAAEYAWTLAQLAEREFVSLASPTASPAPPVAVVSAG